MNYNNVQDSVVECCFQLENNDSNHLTEKAIKLKYLRELDIFFISFYVDFFPVLYVLNAFSGSL